MKSYWSEERAAEKVPARTLTILEKDNSCKRTGIGDPFDGGPVPS